MSREMNRLCKGLGLLSMCVAFLFAAETHAASYVHWCSRWPSVFTDSSGVGGEEDVYFNTSQTNRSARYSEVSLHKRIQIGGQAVYVHISTAYLTESIDGRYCTPAIEIPDPGTYRFVQRTRLKRGDRTITVATDASSFDSPSPLSFSYTYSLGWTSGTHTIDAPINTVYKQTSMAVVASRLLRFAGTLDWPNDLSQGIVVKLNPTSTTCPNDEYMGYFPTPAAYGTCVRSSTAGIKKFVAGHELGHVIAHMTEPGQSIRGLLPTSYAGDCDDQDADTPNCPGLFTPAQGACRYPGITTRGHQMQSREFIQTAVGESFAHFTASVLFNDREYGATFNHRKALWVDPDGPGGADGWLEHYSHLLHWDDRDPQQWLVDFCEPPTYWPKGFGVERDWAPFFWQIWAHGTTTTRFDVSEIIDVFAGTSWTFKCCTNQHPLLPGITYCRDPDIVNGERQCSAIEELFKMGRFWDDLVTTMNNQGHSLSKRNFFREIGDDNGLNY